jgi:hypothetical protein
MSAAGRPPPPFIGQGEAAYRRAAWFFVQHCSTGVQCLRFDRCPTDLALAGVVVAFVLVGE